MKVYFLIDDYNLDEFDDYMDISKTPAVAIEVFNKLVNFSFEWRNSLKGGLKRETTYYSEKEVTKELEERNKEKFFSWSIICESDIDENSFSQPRDPYEKVDISLPEFKARSLYFHKLKYRKEYNKSKCK